MASTEYSWFHSSVGSHTPGFSWEMCSAMTSSFMSSMPKPGRSGTSIKPFWIKGLRMREMIRSSHQGTSLAWNSQAQQFSVATPMWAAAMAWIGVAAWCSAMRTP